MPSRGWIIPVGGTTPDRHKVGTLPLCWLRNADYQIPVRSIGQDLLLPVGNRAGRGLHPRPERSTPAKYSPTLPNSSPPSPCKSSYFLSSVLCSCVGGSFRSGVQPPTGTKSERSPLCWLRGVEPPTVTRSGTLPLCWLRNADYQIPVRSIGQDLLLPVGNRAGRGLNPRPAQGRPAFPNRHKDGRHSPTGTRMAGIPRPAQGRPAFRDRRRMTDARGGAGAFIFLGGGRLPGPPASWGRG